MDCCTVHWFYSMNSCWDKYQNIFNTNTCSLNVSIHINSKTTSILKHFYIIDWKNLIGCFVEYVLFLLHESNGFALCEFAFFFFLNEVGRGILWFLKVAFWQWKYRIKCNSNLGYILPELLYGFNCSGGEKGEMSQLCYRQILWP